MAILKLWIGALQTGLAAVQFSNFQCHPFCELPFSQATLGIRLGFLVSPLHIIPFRCFLSCSYHLLGKRKEKAFWTLPVPKHLLLAGTSPYSLLSASVTFRSVLALAGTGDGLLEAFSDGACHHQEEAAFLFKQLPAEGLPVWMGIPNLPTSLGGRELTFSLPADCSTAGLGFLYVAVSGRWLFAPRRQVTAGSARQFPKLALALF